MIFTLLEQGTAKGETKGKHECTSILKQMIERKAHFLIFKVVHKGIPT